VLLTGDDRMKTGRSVKFEEDCDLCGKEPPKVRLQRVWIGHMSPYILCARCGMLVYTTKSLLFTE